MLKSFTPSRVLFQLSVFLVILSTPHLFFAQQTIWKNVNEPTSVQGKRYFIPQKYRVVQLDLTQLKTTLSRAPMEFTSAARNSDVVIELPMPDNTTQKFSVVESPIMEEGLAKQYPDIKTYAGTSLSNARTTIRFDVTPKGFHAMVLSPEGSYFVDPYSNGTTEFYISYAKKDHISTRDFTCHVEDSGLPTIEVPEKKKENGQTPSPLDFSSSDVTGNRIGDCVLRTYRLALAATGEYTTFHGGTVAGALAAQVTSMNRINGVFIQDFAVKMLIVANNNLIIYTNSATDPYTNNNGSTMLSENQTNLNAVIGTANYDIGHVFSTGGGGVAYLNSPCSSFKAGGVTGSGSPVGDDFDIDYVAHEMGHQFGGNHSYNNSCSNNRNAGTAFEPGSGTTIMSYAGICAPNIAAHSDAYFHGGNFTEMLNFITGTGNACSAKPSYTNAFPAITSSTASQTIPKGTPILLTGAATDADGNASITYCWEQMDVEISTQVPLSTATGGPNFRSYNPTTNNTRYLPRLADLAANAATTWEVLPTVARNLKFRLVARDNAVGGGCNDHADITLTVDAASGPVVVNIPSAAGISWAGGSSQTVTWAVANTNVAPVSCATVDILLSTDGGLTFPTTVAAGVTNNGSASVTIPNIASTTARLMVRGTGKAFFDISNNNFTITAGSGCTAPVATASTVTQPTCAVATGSIVVNATGSGTLEYSVNNGGAWQPSATFLGLAAGTYNVIVRLQATPTCMNTATAVVINAQPATPTAPSVGTITQPTCAVATGSVVLNGLPATGTWTLTRSPGAVTSTGTGTSTTVSGLTAGTTYTFTVSNAAGCTSVASANVVINAILGAPTAPSVGTITQPTCAVATGSVVLNGLPAGSWTIMPGNITGTGTSTTVSGLAGGTYNYTVTNAAGCTSTASANVVIVTATGCCSTTIPPTVTLTSPTNGSTTSTNLNFTAIAADADGTVSTVNFYWVTGVTKTGVITRILLGSDNTAPYTFTWTNIPGGNYNVQAEAVDNCNAKTFSTVSNVTILETMSVSITSPLSSQGFVPGNNITIASSVINYSARTVSKVEFYIGNTKVGEDLTAPYTFLWTNVQSGNYALATKATDNLGGVWSSPTYLITLGASSRNDRPTTGGNSSLAQNVSMTTSPNPARSRVVVSTDVPQDGDYGLTISDFIGKVVLTKKASYVKGANNETLDVSNLAKGIYIVRLANTETGEFAVQKLVID
jgi:Metallo-peptidase family M12B Reprolysin-like/Secretion system C-terminal sorting domain/Bacterial Ig domain